MTSHDSWIVERARRNKADAPKIKRAGITSSKGRAAVDDLWASLQTETKRQAAVYNDAFGEKAVTVTTEGDVIELRASDGRQLTIRFDRNGPSLSERYRSESGLVRVREPRVKFMTNSVGELTFSFGGVQEAAGSILKRLI